MIHQHDLTWDVDDERWHCSRCHRASMYSGKSDAAMEMGQYLCDPKRGGA